MGGGGCNYRVTPVIPPNPVITGLQGLVITKIYIYILYYYYDIIISEKEHYNTNRLIYININKELQNTIFILINNVFL